MFPIPAPVVFPWQYSCNKSHFQPALLRRTHPPSPFFDWDFVVSPWRPENQPGSVRTTCRDGFQEPSGLGTFSLFSSPGTPTCGQGWEPAILDASRWLSPAAQCLADPGMTMSLAESSQRHPSGKKPQREEIQSVSYTPPLKRQQRLPGQQDQSRALAGHSSPPEFEEPGDMVSALSCSNSLCSTDAPPVLLQASACPTVKRVNWPI